ncbi:Epsin-1 [Mytilus coruscus]|uniref:Epsin-1 n=1 Tax=Mytilus coruscus TaxID=42192 RepID=A0A6J8C9S5_MYTCO|nr:Epsin-1 [Mytilus coruscus]
MDTALIISLLILGFFTTENECQTSLCKEPNRPKNGQVNCVDNGSGVLECYATCNGGFTFQTTSVEFRTCKQIDGSWSAGNTFPDCIDSGSRCRSLSPPKNGVVRCESVNTQLVCTAECDRQHVFPTGQAALKRVCNASVGWQSTDQIPDCKAGCSTQYLISGNKNITDSDFTTSSILSENQNTYSPRKSDLFCVNNCGWRPSRSDLNQFVQVREKQFVQVREKQFVQRKTVRTGKRKTVRTGKRKTVRLGKRKPVCTGKRKTVRTGKRKPVRTGKRNKTVCSGKRKTVRTGKRNKTVRTGKRKPVRTGKRKPVRSGKRKPVRSGKRKTVRTGKINKTVRTGKRKPVRSGKRKPVRSGKRKTARTGKRNKTVRTGKRKPVRTGKRKTVRTGKRNKTINLQKAGRLLGITTKGISVGPSELYVTRFRILHSMNGKIFTPYSDENVTDKFFSGNTDAYSPKMQVFSCPFEAQYIRINPLEWHDGIGLRFDLLGCDIDSIPKTTVRPQTPPRLVTTISTQSTPQPTTGLTSGATGKTTIPQQPCSPVLPPPNGVVNCQKTATELSCTAICNDGFQFTTTKSLIQLTCQLRTGTWSNGENFPACIRK